MNTATQTWRSAIATLKAAAPLMPYPTSTVVSGFLDGDPDNISEEMFLVIAQHLSNSFNHVMSDASRRILYPVVYLAKSMAATSYVNSDRLDDYINCNVRRALANLQFTFAVTGVKIAA